MKNNVLIISGHPDLSQSFANKALLNEVQNIAPEFKIRDLGSLYPDFKIDIEAEQAALIKADIIVWQFPIQWFSAPAIFKKWLDDVMAHGFAYGSKGKYLEGKKVIISVTIGGEAHEYAKDDRFGHTIEEFIVPITESIPYCNMAYAGLVYSTDMIYIEGISDAERLSEVESNAKKQVQELIDLINNNIE